MAEELEVNGLPCLVFGEGSPLVVFPGLGMTNANPTGVQRWGEMRLLSPLARRFTVHRIGRRVGLQPGTTMADLASDYAGAAYRLSEHGRAFQRRTAELSAAGDRRGLSRMQAPDVTDSRLGQRIAGPLLALAGPLFIKRDWDPYDMISTIRAEDTFDLRDRLGEISAPTLVIGGGRDRFYPRSLFEETAQGIPNSRLVIYENRAHGGTLTDRRFGNDTVSFLTVDGQDGA